MSQLDNTFSGGGVQNPWFYRETLSERLERSLPLAGNFSSRFNVLCKGDDGLLELRNETAIEKNGATIYKCLRYGLFLIYQQLFDSSFRDII